MCRRQYYYHYYGSWGGWERSAPPLARKLYILKKVISLPLLVGDVIHRTVAEALGGIMSGNPISVESSERRAVGQFRAAWRSSKRREWESQPRKPNLFEHYYGGEVTPERLLRMRDTILRCMRNFYASGHYGFLQGLGREQWLATETLDSFQVSGTKVWATLDLAVRSEGKVRVYDWKSGQRAGDDIRQMGVYGLYAAARWRKLPKNILLTTVYLRDGTSRGVHFGASELNDAEALIRESSGKMRDLLREPDRACPDDFPMVEDPAYAAAARSRRSAMPTGAAFGRRRPLGRSPG